MFDWTFSKFQVNLQQEDFICVSYFSYISSYFVYCKFFKKTFKKENGIVATKNINIFFFLQYEVEPCSSRYVLVKKKVAHLACLVLKVADP